MGEIFKSKAEIAVALIIAIALITGVVSVYFFQKPDNIVEEISEGVVENQLNLPAGTIDLTPSSKEN